jgi:hypothetical protein
MGIKVFRILTNQFGIFFFSPLECFQYRFRKPYKSTLVSVSVSLSENYKLRFHTIIHTRGATVGAWTEQCGQPPEMTQGKDAICV